MCCSFLKKKKKKQQPLQPSASHLHNPLSKHGHSLDHDQELNSSASNSLSSAAMSSEFSSLSSTSMASVHSLLPEGPTLYRFEEIALATGNFDPAKQIGRSVWKASLRNIPVVISKKHRSNTGSGGGVSPAPRFTSMLRRLHSLHHSSLVKLLGACHEGEFLYLVYEFLESSNLDDALRSKLNVNYSALPSWCSRLQISVDIVKGLEYLHHHCDPMIVHKYLDSRNILVSNKLRAKIAHVGIAVLTGEINIFEMKTKANDTILRGILPCPQEETEEKVIPDIIDPEKIADEKKIPDEIVELKMTDENKIPDEIVPVKIVEEKKTLNGGQQRKFLRSRSIKINGIQGYMPPEYTMRGEVSSKYDVYAFGIILAELLSGKDKDVSLKKKVPIPEMLNSIMRDDNPKGRLRIWMDPLLRDSFPIDDALKVANLAKSCVDPDPEKRPDMSEVASNLQKYLASAMKWQINVDAQRELMTSTFQPR